MARLFYSAITSVDGYIEDEGGAFDWAAPDNEVHAFVNDAERDVSIGGPALAAAAFSSGLIDELRLYVVPIIVGGGKPAMPPGVVQHLALVDERRFTGGTAYLRYRVVR